MRALVALSLVLVAAAGCASTGLVVNLDLYRDDTKSLISPLTPPRVGRLMYALTTAGPEIDALARDRIDLADKLFDSYEAVVKVSVMQVTAARPEVRETPENRNIVVAREYLADYRRAVERQRVETHDRLRTAIQKLQAYVGRRDAKRVGAQVDATEALQAIDDAARAMSRMGGPLGTDFEKSLVDNWSVVAKSVATGNLEKLAPAGAGAPERPEMAQLRARVTALGQQLEQLRQQGRRVPQQVARVLAGAMKEVQPEPGRLKASLDTVANAMTAVPVSLGYNDRGAAALHDLALSSTLLFSQVDRLQDPADPIWRTITAPENARRWNTTFSETYFYSEGNNSVVVVRDTPFSFRLQRGNNNPAALIQGQAQISRAIANAAIAVAGAASGVPVPKLPGAGGSGGSAATDTNGEEAERIAKRKATVDRQIAVRASTLASLRRQMMTLRSQLAQTDPSDQAAVDAVLSQMQSTLEAYETALKAN